MSDDSLESEGIKAKRSPERTCLATGDTREKAGMIRFVLSPDGELVPDVVGTLPGRGVWVSATREAMHTVIRKGGFSRGFKKQIKADATLVDRVEQRLRARLIHWISLGNKCGDAVMGFAKVEAALKANTPALVFLAADAGAADSDKIQSLIEKRRAELCSLLTRAELAQPFGREDTVHVAVQPGGIAQQMQKEIRRLAGFCTNLAL